MSKMMLRIILTLVVSLSLFYLSIAQKGVTAKPTIANAALACPECVAFYGLKEPIKYDAATNTASISTNMTLNYAPQKVEAIVATATTSATGCQNTVLQNAAISIQSMSLSTPLTTTGSVLYATDALTTLLTSNTNITTNLVFSLPPQPCLPCNDVVKICIRYVFTCIENGKCKTCEKTICHEIKRAGKQCP
jgi:hypothetical protein